MNVFISLPLPKGFLGFFCFFGDTIAPLDTVVVELNVDLVVVGVNSHGLVQHRLVGDDAVLGVELYDGNRNLLQSDGDRDLHLAVTIHIPPLDNAVGQNLHLPLLPTNDIKLVSDLVVLPHSRIQVFAVEHPPANGSVVAESERVHRECVLRAKTQGIIMGKPERY